jgi:ATP-binding cassette subfamily C protein LapB
MNPPPGTDERILATPRPSPPAPDGAVPVLPADQPARSGRLLYSIQVLNRYLALGIDSTLLTLTVGALIAVVFELALRSARLRIAQWLCARADAALGEAVFDSSVRGQYALLEQLPVAARREILSGLATTQQSFGASNLITLLDAPFAFVFLLVLALLNPILALTAILVMGGVVLVSLLAQRRLRSPWKPRAAAPSSSPATSRPSPQAPSWCGPSRPPAPCASAGTNAPPNSPACAPPSAACRTPSRTPATPAACCWACWMMAMGAREVLAGRLDVGSLIGANILAGRALAALTRALGLGEAIGRGQRALELIRQLNAIPRSAATA